MIKFYASLQSSKAWCQPHVLPPKVSHHHLLPLLYNPWVTISTAASILFPPCLGVKMIKFRSRRLFRSNSKVAENSNNGQIEWEVRPGGMLVQKRVSSIETDHKEMVIRLRISTVSQCHHISIQPTSTFGKSIPSFSSMATYHMGSEFHQEIWKMAGEMKEMLSMVTGLRPREQRLLFKGRERDDGDHLHMVGVKEGDKVLLLEDPAFKERKLRSLMFVMRQAIKV